MGTEFLKVASSEDAVKRVLKSLSDYEPPVEEVDLTLAHGRILARSLFSKEDLPGFSRSSVDGFAVRAADTSGASETEPIYLNIKGEVPMGAFPDFTVDTGEAAVILTGGAVPQGSDAVVMIEHTEIYGRTVSVLKPVAPGENVISADEDLKEGTLICAKGTRLAPRHIGALAAVGITRIFVYARPKIGIISTGDEIIPPEEKPLPGQVRDVNTVALRAAILEQGCEAVSYGIVEDRFDLIFELSNRALGECDGLIISGGSSAGVRDITIDVISALGNPGVLVHGIRLKPGKPTLLGVCDGKVVAGFPGNPASALVVFSEVFRPLLGYLKGESAGIPRGVPRVKARLKKSVPSSSGRVELVPVEIVEEGSSYVAIPVSGRSNLIGTLARANGFLRIFQDVEGMERGTEVDLELAD